MKKSIVLLFIFSVLFLLTNFRTIKSLKISGTYILTESVLDNVKISHRLELQENNLCTWQTITKRNNKKEKCKRTGSFKVTEDKIYITWSKNECDNCGTYMNWYDKDCPIETLEFKDNTLITTGEVSKRFIKTK